MSEDSVNEVEETTSDEESSASTSILESAKFVRLDSLFKRQPDPEEEITCPPISDKVKVDAAIKPEASNSAGLKLTSDDVLNAESSSRDYEPVKGFDESVPPTPPPKTEEEIAAEIEFVKQFLVDSPLPLSPQTDEEIVRENLVNSPPPAQSDENDPETQEQHPPE